MSAVRLFAAVGLLCRCLLLLGCGASDIGTVAGRVTLDGGPVTHATIVFENSTRGVSVNAPLAADGSFTLRTFDKAGLPPGDYQVAIRPGVFGSGETPLVSAPQAGAPAAMPIPARYHSVVTSGLTAQVSLGSNPPFDFPLVSSPK